MEEAIINDDIETVKYLLEQGFDPNHKTETLTPLIFIANNLEILKLLLEYGADPKCPDEYGFILEEYSDDAAVLLLLEKPRNAIIVEKTKTIKYKETLRLRRKKNKTLRSKASKQSY